MRADEELVRREVRAWTVGELRAARPGLPDELPLVVQLAEEPGGDTVAEKVVTGAGFGTVEWTVRG